MATHRPLLQGVRRHLPPPGGGVNRALLDEGIVGGFDLGRYAPDLADCLLLCCTELTTRAEIDRLVAALKDL